MSDRPEHVDPTAAQAPPDPVAPTERSRIDGHSAVASVGQSHSRPVIASDQGSATPIARSRAVAVGTEPLLLDQSTLVPERPSGSSPWEGDLAGAELRVPRDPRSRLALVSLLLALVAFGLSLLSVVNAPRFSALDENTHLDYAYQLSHGHLAYSGQLESPYTINSWACRSQAGLPTLPPCNSGLPNSAYPGGAVQYNGFHPPLYYAITGVTARALAAITGKDFMTVARSLGAVWLFAGMLAMYLTLRYWRLGWGWAMGGALLLPLFPAVLHASSTVTNDAPVMLAGVAALFLIGRATIYHRTGWILPVLFIALAAATKSISAVALLAVALGLLIFGIARLRGTDSREGVVCIRNSVLMVVTFVAVHFGWQAIAGRLVPEGFVSPIEGAHTAEIVGLPFDEWMPTLLSGASLGANYYLDPTVNGRYLAAWIIGLSTVIAGTGLIGLALFRRGRPAWVASGLLLIGIVEYPLFVQLQSYLAGVYFPGMNDRYGMSLIPLAVGVLALIVERRNLRKTSAVVLALGSVAVLTATLGLQQ